MSSTRKTLTHVEDTISRFRNIENVIKTLSGALITKKTQDESREGVRIKEIQIVHGDSRAANKVIPIDDMTIDTIILALEDKREETVEELNKMGIDIF